MKKKIKKKLLITPVPLPFTKDRDEEKKLPDTRKGTPGTSPT